MAKSSARQRRLLDAYRVDAGQALTAGPANAAGLGVGKALATAAKVLASSTVPGSAGLPVISNSSKTFTIGASEAKVG